MLPRVIDYHTYFVWTHLDLKSLEMQELNSERRAFQIIENHGGRRQYLQRRRRRNRHLQQGDRTIAKNIHLPVLANCNETCSHSSL